MPPEQYHKPILEMEKAFFRIIRIASDEAVLLSTDLYFLF